MVGDNLDMHVLSMLARAAYAKSPSQPIFSVLISYFSGTLYPHMWYVVCVCMLARRERPR